MAVKPENRKLYAVWDGMKQRCYNPNSKNYRKYGARGIKVCEEWRNNSSAFIAWCREHGYKEGLALDRIDNTGNYEPNNCRFVSPSENNLNKRNTVMLKIDGVMVPAKVVAERFGINYITLIHRIKKGFTGDKLLYKDLRGVKFIDC